jgi:integrase
MKGMEEDDSEEEQRNSRKTRRALPYEVLAEVPNKIRGIREAGNHSPKQIALLVLYEFLLRWWLALPWRQRNIRECRIGANPNIFKGEVPSSAGIRKPDWVERALERNPHEQFWQMRFSKQETKTGNDFTAIVPLGLVPLLELYVTQYRPVLVRGIDPGTLFVNFRGKPFTDKRLTMLLESLTFHYAGRAINPHLLRDIFAYKWLDEHPEDYLTLSKILWHRDIKTTLHIYGRNFNESNGVSSVDDWLRLRKSKK